MQFVSSALKLADDLRALRSLARQVRQGQQSGAIAGVKLDPRQRQAVTASTELSFSDDELTLYARVNGRRRFPYAVDEDLGDAGWEAIARGLAARRAARRP